MQVRTIPFVAVAVLAAAGAWLLAGRAGSVGIPTVVAAAAVLAVIVGGKVARAYVHLVAMVAGAISLTATVYVVVAPVTINQLGRNLGPVELVALYALLAAIARWTVPLRAAVTSGAVVWVACVVWVLRLVAYQPRADPPLGPWPITSGFDLIIVLSHFGAMAFPATVAVLAGGAPRFLMHRRRELISAVRHEQRLELAQDLHDFVSHDLTGIVAQAQAARFARADDLDHLRRALERIEHVGVSALDAMDGFVQILHNDGDVAPRSMRRVADIPGLVDRFRSERRTESPVHVEVDDNVETGLSRELEATAYRVVVEGLTNVRRHAGPECPVTVSVKSSRHSALCVTVHNDVSGPQPLADPHRRSGGTGLIMLKERVAAVGGQLEAGRDSNGGWRLCATLPYANKDGAR